MSTCWSKRCSNWRLPSSWSRVANLSQTELWRGVPTQSGLIFNYVLNKTTCTICYHWELQTFWEYTKIRIWTFYGSCRVSLKKMNLKMWKQHHNVASQWPRHSSKKFKKKKKKTIPCPRNFWACIGRNIIAAKMHRFGKTIWAKHCLCGYCKSRKQTEEINGREKSLMALGQSI